MDYRGKCAWIATIPESLLRAAEIAARWEMAGVDGYRSEKIDASGTEFRIVRGVAFVNTYGTVPDGIIRSSFMDHMEFTFGRV